MRVVLSRRAGCGVDARKWFLAQEQPELKVFGTTPKFSDPEYLTRFGFLPDATGAENPHGRSVGFAKDTVTDVKSGQRVDVIGLSCAAGHTGQVEYRGEGSSD